MSRKKSFSSRLMSAFIQGTIDGLFSKPKKRKKR